MTLRDEIEALVERDNRMSAHHLGAGRVVPDQLHPVREDVERLTKSRASYKARAVVESFHAQVEGRAMRPLDQVVPGFRQSLAAPLSRDGVTVSSVRLDPRQIVEVLCEAEDFEYDLPIFLVNPSLLVADPLGDVEVIVGEDGNGDPIVQRYREDPTQAMVDVLVRLRNRQVGGA